MENRGASAKQGKSDFDVSHAIEGPFGTAFMTGASRRLSLDVSEEFFRLATEALRLRSNDVLRCETLDGMFNQRILKTANIDEVAPDTIRQHLSVVPTQGNVRLSFSINATSADNLAEVKRQLCMSLDFEITAADTLSILLFHYVIAQKAARVFERIGLRNSQVATDTSEMAKIAEGNVVRIR